MDCSSDEQSKGVAMKWAYPTEARVHAVGRNLRKADCDEVWLSHRMEGLDAVLTSWRESKVCRCMTTENDEVVGITGLVGNRIWMLGTDNLIATRQNRVQLCINGRDWVKHCLSAAGMAIGNDVYSKNTDSIRWLKHLGFEVAKPRPMGHSGALFCEFWMTP